jgi:hypothetical protein
LPCRLSCRISGSSIPLARWATPSATLGPRGAAARSSAEIFGACAQRRGPCMGLAAACLHRDAAHRSATPSMGFRVVKEQPGLQWRYRPGFSRGKKNPRGMHQPGGSSTIRAVSVVVTPARDFSGGVSSCRACSRRRAQSCSARVRRTLALGTHIRRPTLWVRWRAIGRCDRLCLTRWSPETKNGDDLTPRIGAQV